jgi:hypothetical protein
VSTITFAFRNGLTTLRYHFFARCQFLSAKGYALITNGLDPNTKWDPDVGLSNLLLRAPADEVYPAITFAPSPDGKIYGNGMKWRIRYKNSQTGEVSGMSPIPTIGLNLGDSKTSGSADYLGQIAYFTVYGVATTYGVDTIQLFRNTAQQDEVWYLVDEKSNPGASTTVSFTDNFGDEDIWNNELAEITPNPTYFVPHPTPCARSFLHGTGRVMLYGFIPMGAYRAGTAAVTAGSNTVTGANTHWHRGREGQQFKFITDPDRVVYRIIEVTDQTSMKVTPVPPADVSATTYEILDDRDGRQIFMLWPTSPAQFDPRDVLTVGLDKADTVKYVFSIGSTTFCFTRHHVYEMENDRTGDPAQSTRFTIRANIGCVGLWAACATPFGIVFVSDNGVYIFDGTGVPVPLGEANPFDDFSPKDQFARMDPALWDHVYAYYDSDHNRVGISYCPVEVAAMTEQLSFDPHQGWRGPWRRPVFASGKLRNAEGDDVFLLGDQFGQLLLEEDIVTDLVAPVSGTVLTRDSTVVFTSTASVFTSAMVGASIVFDDGAGNYQVNWIARYVSATQVVLLLVPSTALVAGWTFKVGGIYWIARTAFIDLGEPGQPKTIREIMLRYDRVLVGTDNLVLDITSDGKAYTPALDTTTPSTGGLIKATAGVNVGGTAFTLRASGRAIYGNPKLTNILAHVIVSGGNADPTVGDTKKVVITPTVTS